MTTYYVKNGGDNGLDGLSSANAWETVTYALTQMIAYDVLNIAAGAYPEDVAVTTEHITLTGAGSGSVTISNLYPRASHLTCRGLTITARIVGDTLDVTNIELDDVVSEGTAQFACVNAAAITNCDFTTLLLLVQGDAASFTDIIIRRGVSNALYVGLSVGANTTFTNTTILGANPAAGGIQIASGTNLIFTNTTFEDPENAIEISGGASATFIQDSRKVFVGTVGSSTITPTEATLVVADGSYAYRDFVITPDASITIPETSLWQTFGDKNKIWKVEATGSRAVTFRLADMLPDTVYNIFAGIEQLPSATSDSFGVLTFSYTGTFSEKQFNVERYNVNVTTKRRPRKSS